MIRMDQTNSSSEASQALSIGPSEMHNSVLSRKHIWWGFPFGIVAILFGAFLCFCIKTKLYRSCRQRSEQEGNLDAEEVTLRRFQFEELAKATGNFSPDCLVGSVAFGNVYTGTLNHATWRIAHSHQGIKPSIIHRDLKPSNILVGEGFEAKISDFGLVRSGSIGDKSHVSRQIKGTPGYLDPAYCLSLHLSPFSDVYSFGARPSLERGIVEEILDAKLLLEPYNSEMMLKVGQLGPRCVAKVPKKHPTMTQGWQELEAALYSAENSIHNQPRWRSTSTSRRPTDQGNPRSTEHNDPQSLVSV